VWINQSERAQTDAAATDALPTAPTTTVTNATRLRQGRSLSGWGPGSNTRHLD
jgi:hypothetical protein